MVLKTKSIRAEESLSDGLRICIMREYHPEKHPEYKRVDKHWISLSPSSQLLHDLHNGLPWEEYVTRFNSEVLISEADNIRDLAETAMKKNVTVLCYELTPENCHRRIVALACKMYQPSLEVILE